jgi:sugar lactone lactonase YvrE
MKSTLVCLLVLTPLLSSSFSGGPYEFVPDWLTPPPGKETIGNGHGEIAVDSAGNIYVSVQEKEAGLQVYGPDGKFIKGLPLPSTLHGFVIHKNDEGEFIYAAVLGEQRVIKAKLDGTVMLEIPKSSFPEEQAAKGLKLTNCDVAPNGDIYVVDGYGQSWIFQFDKTGKFKKVFGGPVAPYNFKNTHKIFIDPRFSPPRIFACDRGNNRMLHLDLDGNIIGVNDTRGQTNTPKVEPKDWQQGTVTSPHGITFDANGNILETEWNEFGRVLRWNSN